MGASISYRGYRVPRGQGAEFRAAGARTAAAFAAAPQCVEYELTRMGRELAPALAELESWAHRWLD